MAKGCDAATVRANLSVWPLRGKSCGLEAVRERLVSDGDSCLRDDVIAELGWSPPTVNRWVDQSKRFMRVSDGGSARATIVRRPPDVAATAPFEGPGAQGEGGQDELPL